MKPAIVYLVIAIALSISMERRLKTHKSAKGFYYTKEPQGISYYKIECPGQKPRYYQMFSQEGYGKVYLFDLPDCVVGRAWAIHLKKHPDDGLTSNPQVSIKEIWEGLNAVFPSKRTDFDHSSYDTSEYVAPVDQEDLTEAAKKAKALRKELEKKKKTGKQENK